MMSLNNSTVLVNIHRCINTPLDIARQQAKLGPYEVSSYATQVYHFNSVICKRWENSQF